MKKVPALLLPIVILLLLALEIHAESVGISYLGHRRSEDKIETSFALTGGLSFDIIDAIKNGLDAKLSLNFQLSHVPGPMGIGKQVISERTINFTISYDVWDNSFMIEDRRKHKTTSASGSNTLMKKISETVSPLSFSCSSVEHDEQLVVRGKIRVQTVKLFPPFGLFLVFFDPWNFESDWMQSEPFTLNGI
jgi:hypothetical protein